MKIIWRWVRIVAGFLLLGLGLVALLLPVVPQVPFILGGLLLLAREFHWARRLLEWARSKWSAARAPSAGADP